SPAGIGGLFRIHVPVSRSDGRRDAVLQSLRDGFGYVRQEKLITTYLLVSSIFNIFGRSFVTLLPVFAKEILRIGASGFGFIAAAPGLGTIMGSFSLAALGRVEARRDILVTILLAFSGSLFVFAASRDLRIAFTCLVIVGAVRTVVERLLNTSIQLRVEEAYQVG